MSELWKWLHANERCNRCGKPFTEDVICFNHHLIPRSEANEYIPGNIAPLCPNCHAYIHTKKMKSIGYIKPKPSRMGRGRRFLLELTGRDIIGEIYKREQERITLKPPHQCPLCGSIGKVVEVTEFSKSIYITLTCTNCGKKFVAEFH